MWSSYVPSRAMAIRWSRRGSISRRNWLPPAGRSLCRNSPLPMGRPTIISAPYAAGSRENAISSARTMMPATRGKGRTPGQMIMPVPWLPCLSWLCSCPRIRLSMILSWWPGPARNRPGSRVRIWAAHTTRLPVTGRRYWALSAWRCWGTTAMSRTASPLCFPAILSCFPPSAIL